MRRPRRLAALLLLAAVLPGACDSYNLSLKEFFTAAPGRQDDEGKAGEAALSARAITAFSISGLAGTIDEGAKTITLTVPLGTNRNGLTPTITHTGAGISPASGEAQNFSGPVVYTVAAADGSTTIYTVTVTASGNADSAAGVAVYLSTATDEDTVDSPIVLPSLNFDLTGSGWTELLAAIAAAGKYVSLDLSGCTGGTEFDLDTASTGKDYITDLTLPGTATSVKAGSDTSHIFQDFTNLKSVTGGNIQTVGEGTFAECQTLSTVSLPNAATIGEAAFSGCIGLTSVNLSSAADIGAGAFAECQTLSTVSLPNAATIGEAAFSGCIGLTSVSLSSAADIGDGAFSFTGTTALTVTLGNTPPTLGIYMFGGVGAAKNVAVKVPLPVLSNYNTGDWSGGFRGRGWDGTGCIENDTEVNTYITLTISRL